MSDQRRGTAIRGYLFGAATAVLVLTMGVPGVVSADGGEAGLIHACILPDAVEGNVRIVDANESCPRGTTTVHWTTSGSQPAFDSPEVSTPTKKSVQPSGKVNKKLYKPLGIKASQTKNVTKTLGPFESIDKDLTVSCPTSHPFVLYGSPWVVEPEWRYGEQILSQAVGWHAWRVVHQTWGWQCVLGQGNCPSLNHPYSFGWTKVPVVWTLQVTITCAKVVKQPETAKIAS